MNEDRMKALLRLGGDTLDIQPGEPHTHTEGSDPLECRGCWADYIYGEET